MRFSPGFIFKTVGDGLCAFSRMGRYASKDKAEARKVFEQVEKLSNAMQKGSLSEMAASLEQFLEMETNPPAGMSVDFFGRIRKDKDSTEDFGEGAERGKKQKQAESERTPLKQGEKEDVSSEAERQKTQSVSESYNEVKKISMKLEEYKAEDPVFLINPVKRNIVFKNRTIMILKEMANAKFTEKLKSKTITVGSTDTKIAFGDFQDFLKEQVAKERAGEDIFEDVERRTFQDILDGIFTEVLDDDSNRDKLLQLFFGYLSCMVYKEEMTFNIWTFINAYEYTKDYFYYNAEREVPGRGSCYVRVIHPKDHVPYTCRISSNRFLRMILLKFLNDIRTYPDEKIFFGEKKDYE